MFSTLKMGYLKEQSLVTRFVGLLRPQHPSSQTSDTRTTGWELETTNRGEYPMSVGSNDRWIKWVLDPMILESTEPSHQISNSNAFDGNENMFFLIERSQSWSNKFPRYFFRLRLQSHHHDRPRLSIGEISVESLIGITTDTLR